MLNSEPSPPYEISLSTCRRGAPSYIREEMKNHGWEIRTHGSIQDVDSNKAVSLEYDHPDHDNSLDYHLDRHFITLSFCCTDLSR